MFNTSTFKVAENQTDDIVNAPSRSPCNYFSIVSGRERTILNEFFVATNGKYWTGNRHWTTRTSRKEWQGLTLGSHRSVSCLRLANNELKGSIPVSLGELNHLNELSLGGNQLYGKITCVELLLWPLKLIMEY